MRRIFVTSHYQIIKSYYWSIDQKWHYPKQGDHQITFLLMTWIGTLVIRSVPACVHVCLKSSIEIPASL